MSVDKEKNGLELSRKEGLFLSGILLGSIASAGVGLSVTSDAISKSPDPLVGGLIGVFAGAAATVGVLAASTLFSSVLIKEKPLDILKMLPIIVRRPEIKITLAMPIILGAIGGASAAWDNQKNLLLETVNGNTPIVETTTTTVRDRACGEITSGVRVYTDKSGKQFQVACAPEIK